MNCTSRTIATTLDFRVRLVQPNAVSITDRLREQLLEAWKASGMTLPQLATAIRNVRRKSSYGGPALSRKLGGKTGMTIEEFHLFSQALGVELQWPRSKSGKVA